jgi:hypothetical protein
VSEAVLVRHQLDAPIPAAGIQPFHVLGREGRGIAPDRGVVAVGEGVFHVELKLVDAHQRQQLDDPLQG